MATTVEVGTILIEDRPLLLRALGLASESYAGTWGVLQSLTSSTLERKLHDSGWNCFFMAAEVKSTVFGVAGARTIRRALQRIFLKVQEPDFNCLEVTKIVKRRFLGIPYITVSTHSRHLQQGYLMEQPDQRRNFKTA